MNENIRPRFLTAKYEECECSSVGAGEDLANQNISHGREENGGHFDITSLLIWMMCPCFWLLQTNVSNGRFSFDFSQHYVMNDNVYYCILSSGLASQKTDNVTN